MLASAGVVTIADESATAPQVPVTGTPVLTVTVWQVRNMALETQSHGGIVGASLDAQFPMGRDVPPLAFVIGAWAATGQDPIARSAARLLGTPDWRHADTVVFPLAALQLFVVDVLQHTTATPPGQSTPPDQGTAPAQSPAPDQTTPPGAAASVAPVSQSDDDAIVSAVAPRLASARLLADVPAPQASCSGIASFVDGVLSSVFGALKVSPAEVSDWVSGKIGGTVGVVLGTVAGFFAAFWNKAVEFAETTVRTVLSALTAPILNTLRSVIGALETITTVVSYLKRWTVPLTPDPTSNSFSVQGSAAHRGSVTATIDRQGETQDWPDLLTDCATTLGKPPPTLSSEGIPVTWTTVQQESGLVTVDRPAAPATTGTLDANLSDHLDYTAGREDAKLAASPLVELATVTITAQIRRTEIEQLSDLLISYLSANFPSILQPTIRAVLGSVFGWAKSKLDSITAVDGSTTVVISHHVPDPGTPTPSLSGSPSRSSGPINMCGQFPVSTIVAATGRAVYTTATERDGNSASAKLYACEYTDSVNPDDALDGFNLAVYRGGDPDAIMKALAAALTSGATPTSGIGDRAQVGDGEIDVVVGTDVVVVSDAVHEGDLTDLDPSVLRDLAQKVIAIL